MWQFTELTTGVPGLPSLCIFGSMYSLGVLGSNGFNPSAISGDNSLVPLNSSRVLFIKLTWLGWDCDQAFGRYIYTGKIKQRYEIYTKPYGPTTWQN